MNRINIPETLRKYNLKEVDLSCILLFLASGNKSFAWSQTIGLNSKSVNKATLANSWFNQQSVQMYLFDQSQSLEIEDMMVSNTKSVKTKSTLKSKVNKSDKPIDPIDTETELIESGINSENIKQLLESELSKVKDPDKRTTILLKIADFLSLNNEDQEDFQTPLIYLPARCLSCPRNK